jgi:hypothetical protein
MENDWLDERGKISQRYLRSRCALNQFHTQIKQVDTIAYIGGGIKEFNWLSATLRLVLGRGVRLFRIESRQGIFQNLLVIKPKVAFVNVGERRDVFLELAIAELRRAHVGTAVIAITDNIQIGSKIAHAKLGVSEVLQRDDICTERVAGSLLKILGGGGMLAAGG